MFSIQRGHGDKSLRNTGLSGLKHSEKQFSKLEMHVIAGSRATTPKLAREIFSVDVEH